MFENFVFVISDVADRSESVLQLAKFILVVVHVVIQLFVDPVFPLMHVDFSLTLVRNSVGDENPKGNDDVLQYHEEHQDFEVLPYDHAQMIGQPFFHVVFRHELVRGSDEKVVEARPHNGVHIEENQENVGDDAYLGHELQDGRPNADAGDVSAPASLVELRHFEGVYAHLQTVLEEGNERSNRKSYPEQNDVALHDHDFQLLVQHRLLVVLGDVMYDRVWVFLDLLHLIDGFLSFVQVGYRRLVQKDWHDYFYDVQSN
jgi:hypothetical protein